MQCIIRDSLTGLPMEGALCSTRSISGTLLKYGLSDEDGVVNLILPGTGDYHFTGDMTGYAPQMTVRNVTFNSEVPLFLSERIGSLVGAGGFRGTSELRAVLTWGPQPVDLDFLVEVPDGIGCRPLTLEDPYCATRGMTLRLVSDAYQGYGPETVQIHHFNIPGRYKFKASLFSGLGSFARGAAQVRLLADASALSFSAPPGADLFWHIFNLLVESAPALGPGCRRVWLEPVNALTSSLNYDGPVQNASVRVLATSCPRPQPRSCLAFGDPHYKTFDGAEFAFQRLGDFALAGTPGLTLHARQARCPTLNGTEATCVGALAVRAEAVGPTAATVLAFGNYSGAGLDVQGWDAPGVQLPEWAPAFTTAAGVTLQRATAVGDAEEDAVLYDVFFPEGVQMRAKFGLHGGSVWVYVRQGFVEQNVTVGNGTLILTNSTFAGICGDADGDAADDPDSVSAWSYRVSTFDGSSLFTPFAIAGDVAHSDNGTGQVVANGTVPFGSAALQTYAEALCGVLSGEFEQACLFDVAVSGDLQFGDEAILAANVLCQDVHCVSGEPSGLEPADAQNCICSSLPPQVSASSNIPSFIQSIVFY